LPERDISVTPVVSLVNVMLHLELVPHVFSSENCVQIAAEPLNVPARPENVQMHELVGGGGAGAGVPPPPPPPLAPPPPPPDAKAGAARARAAATASAPVLTEMLMSSLPWVVCDHEHLAGEVLAQPGPSYYDQPA
jgi:hypothetical protein